MHKIQFLKEKNKSIDKNTIMYDREPVFVED